MESQWHPPRPLLPASVPGFAARSAGNVAKSQLSCRSHHLNPSKRLAFAGLRCMLWGPKGRRCYLRQAWAKSGGPRKFASDSTNLQQLGLHFAFKHVLTSKNETLIPRNSPCSKGAGFPHKSPQIWWLPRQIQMDFFSNPIKFLAVNQWAVWLTGTNLASACPL